MNIPPLTRIVPTVAIFTATTLFGADMSPEQRTFFENKIRPVFARHCYECHSSGAKKIGGKLLLDTPAEMLAGGESGPAVIPGRPEESVLVQALRYDGLEMPPKHRLPDAVVNDFAHWVKMGAPDPRVDSAPRSTTPTTSEDNPALWSFKPVTIATPPTVKNREWPRGSVDAFVLSKIESSGLMPAKDADPDMLVRRLFFDLIGLPPSIEEVASFMDECRKDRQTAIHSLVDSLLSSKHFGEKWGRHWLDVARYAESNGNDGLGRNPSFPHAWRYRDWVIRALNADMPYDRFISEQIAGDLLPADSAEERDWQLIATGFLAVGSKPAKAMNDNFEMDVVADQIGVVGSGILALSLGCARCHDHKHDPISTRDYYALAGIFKSTETLWGAAALEPLTAPQTALHELSTIPPSTPPPDSERPKPIKDSKKKPVKPAFPYAPGSALAMGAREAKTVEDAKINIGGESKKTGSPVPRGFPAACGVAGEALAITGSQSGRLQLARWITSAKHPQTARVIVNRVWMHLFGEGIVRTPDDFGAYGDRPSHPELLDHLASEFMNNGWSLKKLVRSLVLTRTWQLSSECESGVREADPENRLWARHNRRRLDAEALRDRMLAATGELDPRPGTGSLIQHEDLLVNLMGNLHRPSNHRSIYLLMLRNSMPPELVPFNFPDGTGVVGHRDMTTLPGQALYLLNNPFVLERAKALACDLRSKSGLEADWVQMAYARVLARNPRPEEVDRCLVFLREISDHFKTDPLSQKPDGTSAITCFCHALLASSEMRYLD